jgi:hypothetical protein
MVDKDAEVQDVLNCLRRHRMTLITFIEVFFFSRVNHAPLQLQEAGFFADGGIRRTFRAMLENSENARCKRQTAKRAMQLYDDFGRYFKHIIICMLRVEVNEVASDVLMHMSPIDVFPQACQEFNLWIFFFAYSYSHEAYLDYGGVHFGPFPRRVQPVEL